jgi:hypothetical protein
MFCIILGSSFVSWLADDLSGAHGSVVYFILGCAAIYVLASSIPLSTERKPTEGQHLTEGQAPPATQANVEATPEAERRAPPIASQCDMR